MSRLRFRWRLLAYSVYFDPHDIWIGVYWGRRFRARLILDICPLPMLHILVSFTRSRRRLSERPHPLPAAL